MNKNLRKWMAFGSLIVFMFLISAVRQTTSSTPPHLQIQAPTSRPKNTTEDYSIDPNRPPDPVCAGNDYDVVVKVRKKSKVEIDGDGHLVEKPARSALGLKIEATSKNVSVGTISPAALVTGIAWLGSADSAEPGSVSFTFHANKPGTTDIWFETSVKSAKGNADHGYLSNTMTIEVVRCPYKIFAYSSWIFNAPNLISVMGVLTSGGMKADPNNQDHLEGEAEAEWNAFSYSDGCDHEHTVKPSTAYFIGDVKSEVLKIRLNFDEVHYASVNCASSNSGDFHLTGIDMVVPAKGGTFKLDTPLQWSKESMQGWTIIAIYPVNGQ